MDKLFSVSELATASGTTQRAVRLYVDKGLLEPIRVGRIICFDEQALVSLNKIQRSKRLGFTLDEIHACQIAQDPKAIRTALTRIEALQSDTKDALTELKHRLKAIPKRK